MRKVKNSLIQVSLLLGCSLPISCYLSLSIHPENISKPPVFCFQGSIERDQWHEIGYLKTLILHFFRAVLFIFNSKMTKSEGESRPYLCKVDISDIEKRKYPTKYYVSEAKTSLTAFSRLLLKPGPSKTQTLKNLDPEQPGP